MVWGRDLEYTGALVDPMVAVRPVVDVPSGWLAWEVSTCPQRSGPSVV